MGKRDVRYEFIRVIAMLLVIGAHSFATVNPGYAEDTFAGTVIASFLFLCNGLFFMISGKFALGVCCRTGADYRKYYLKRIGSVGIPALVGMLLRSMYNVGVWQPDYFLSADFVKEYLHNVLHDFASCEYWFLYKLVGFLAAAPFLGKMLQHASRTDLFWIVGVGIFCNAMEVYLPVLGFATAWDFPLRGWLVMFILGYALERIAETEKEENILLILGVLSWAANILLKRIGLVAGTNDFAPTYAFTACAVFIALKRVYRPGKILDAVMLKIGSLTMPVYLLHMMVLYTILPYIPQWQPLIRSFGLVLATAGLTLILAFILDRTVLSGLQWLYRKLVRLQ